MPISKKKERKEDKSEWKEVKALVDAIFQDTKSERDKMSRYLRQFQGDIWDDKTIKDQGLEDTHKSRAYINMIFTTVSSIAPMITDSNPLTHLVPRMPYMEKLAHKYNKGLEYLWDALDIQMTSYKWVLNAMIMKKGIVKVYFDPEKTFGGDICLDNVDPRTFFIAPGYDDIWKSPYCGVRTDRPLSWIRARFPDAGEIKAETSTFDLKNMKPYKYGDASNLSLSAQFAKVTEIWMKDEETMEDILEDFETEDGEVKKKKTGKKKQKYPNGKFMYFTKDKYLGCEKCDYMHGLPPYVDLDIYTDPSSFLGMGEVDQIEGLNKELNLQLQAIMDHARRSNNPNYMLDISTGLDPEQIKENFFVGGQVYGYDSQFGQNGIPLNEIPYAKMASDVYNVFQILPNLIEEVSGITEISKGEASKKERQSASEVAILVESSHTRTRQKVRNLEWSLKRVAYLLVKMMMQYYTEPKTIYNKDSEGVLTYRTLGNSLLQAIETIGPGQEKINEINNINPDRRKAEVDPEDLQEYEDYRQLMADFGGEDKELDPVIFDFDIIIQTNSTLPMDQQSLSNLMIRLAQMKLVDAEAVLETLKIPNRKEIMGRIEKKQKAAMAAKQGGPRPPQGGQR